MIKMVIGFSVRKKDLEYFVKERYFKFFNDEDIITLNPYNIDACMRACDAFVILGGADINPKLYGEELTFSKDICDEIDDLDYKIIDYAIKNDKPILGICRGLQIMNVYFGGTLHQDICNHSGNTHTIYLTLESDLPKSVIVNSYHHQAIKKLGNDLISVYQADDGIIEMFIHKNLKAMAVQFHPEINADDSFSQLILKKFYALCKRD